MSGDEGRRGSERHSLGRLGARTRALLDELDATRQDVLAPVDLNRALRQLLHNQVAILDALGRLVGPGAPAPTDPAVLAAPRPTPAPQVEGVTPLALEALEAALGEPAALRNGRSHGKQPEPAAAEEAVAEEGSEPAEAGPAKSRAVELLGVEEQLDPGTSRVLVEQFDNRDQSYEKGLDKLNRWLDGGSMGTPFQWRGDHAYLNLNGVSPAGVRNYEDRLMNRMGFSRRLGRLVVPGLRGEIVVYERP